MISIRIIPAGKLLLSVSLRARELSKLGLNSRPSSRFELYTGNIVDATVKELLGLYATMHETIRSFCVGCNESERLYPRARSTFSGIG